MMTNGRIAARSRRVMLFAALAAECSRAVPGGRTENARRAPQMRCPAGPPLSFRPVRRSRTIHPRPQEESADAHGRRTGYMPRQRTNYSRDTKDFPDDFPQRLARFQEESDLS
ncbi:MAG: hypothetical protein F4X66_04350 [Chloroflexi bacterium]|nr:hypothetical protein [Chloroflexota bacterium]MYE39405.1 hypothetical protein [Chloroflexota bacterium]